MTDTWDVVSKRLSNIRQSSMFISTYTENYISDPLCAMELGFAAILDKPIYLLVPKELALPANMIRLAKHIEYFSDEPGSLQAAVERLAQLYEQ